MAILLSCVNAFYAAAFFVVLGYASAMSSASSNPAGLVIVTGGSRGIGSATCHLLASRGYDVVINFHSDDARANEVLQRIEMMQAEEKATSGRYIGRPMVLRADVSKEKEVTRLFDAVEKNFGTRPTGLVNNAGILGPRENDICNLIKTDVDHVFSTNVYGPFFCCKEFIRRTSTKYGGKGGAIVNVSSGSAYTGRPLVYAMSKGALDSMMAGLTQTLPSEGIRINSVAPGVTKTDMVSDQNIESVRPLIPMDRAGEPREIAEAIYFLLSEASSYCCGAKIRVSGGRP